MRSDDLLDSLGVIETYRGVAIHSTQNGKFAAVVGGQPIRLASLAALRKRLDGHQTPVECLVNHRSTGRAPTRRTIVRVTKNNRLYYLAEDGYRRGVVEQSDSTHGYYIFDQAVCDRLTELAAEELRLAQEKAQLLGRLEAVTPAAWDRLQAARQASGTEVAPEGQEAQEVVS